MTRQTRLPVSRLLPWLAPWVLALSAGLAQAAADTALPPSLGKPLQAAQTLFAKGKYREALAQIAQTDAVAKKRPSDILTIEQFRGGIAQRLGDNTLARQAYEKAWAQPGLDQSQRQPLTAALASLSYQQGDFTEAVKWAQHYAASGGRDPEIQGLIPSALYQSGDCKALDAYLGQFDKTSPQEPALQALVACRTRSNDHAGAWQAQLQLAQTYPQPRYWEALINTLERQPDFPLTLKLDAYRLRLATIGSLPGEREYVEMAQLALQNGLAVEGAQILSRGFKQGILGQGKQQERHQRLHRYAEAQSAATQTQLQTYNASAPTRATAREQLVAGQNLIATGRLEEGLTLINQTLSAEDAPLDDVRLQLGTAQWGAGRYQQALTTFTSIGTGEPTGALAQVWRSYVATQVR